MKIGCYLRVSTNEQSVELQKRELEFFLKSKGWDKEEITFYDDTGVSGTTANRVQLKKMLSDARNGNLDKVIIWKLDRLFRSLKDLINTLQEFDTLKLEFISIKDNIDLSTSAGRLMMHMIGAFAEFEASLIRERVKAGLSNAKAKGVVLGRPRENNFEAIKELRNQGKSYKSIQTQLGISKGAVARGIKS